MLARKDGEAVSELQTLKEKLADVTAELEKLKKAPVSNHYGQRDSLAQRRLSLSHH